MSLRAALAGAGMVFRGIEAQPSELKWPPDKVEVAKHSKRLQELRDICEDRLEKSAYELGAAGVPLAVAWEMLAAAAEDAGVWRTDTKWSVLERGVYAVIRGPWADGRSQAVRT